MPQSVKRDSTDPKCVGHDKTILADCARRAGATIQGREDQGIIGKLADAEGHPKL